MSAGGLRGEGSGVSSGVGLTVAGLLLFVDVSISSGTNRFFGGGSGCTMLSVCLSSSFTLLLREVVSRASTGKRRWLFVVVSMGSGRKRLGGREASDMSLYAEERRDIASVITTAVET